MTKEQRKERRKLICRHILTMYDYTSANNREELNKFLEFVIGNYDLDDDLYEMIREDLKYAENNEQDLVSLENEEYKFNVLDRREVC